MATISRQGGKAATATPAKTGGVPKLKHRPTIKEKEVRTPARKAKVDIASLGISLPQDYKNPVDSLDQYSILIHGEKKIGKTSFCSKFPDAFFLEFEPGTKGLRHRGEPVPTWEHFVGYLDLLDANPSYARTIIVDTADIAFKRCWDYICAQAGVEHPTDANDFGKTWQAIDAEFARQMSRLLHGSRGVVFTSHTVIREFESYDGGTYNKLYPNLDKRACPFLLGAVDVIAYYGYYGNRRLITLEGSSDVEAGHRIEQHFLTPRGQRIHSIPCGKSAQDAYDNFVAAFDNKQTDVCSPEEATGLSNVLAKPKRGNKP
jgi:hypothetical protein